MTERHPDALDLPIDASELDPEITRAIEAVVMVAEDPVPLVLLAQLCDVSEELIEAHCSALTLSYASEGRGFVLARVAGGYRYQSHPDQATYVERYVLDGQSSRLSAAALETLAIVAYKQPISRAQVAAIRGVNVDAVIRTLDQRGYIAEIARDSGPGQAVLFGTTQLFLEKVGIDAVGDLPALGEFVPGPEVVEQLEAGLRVDDDPASGASDQIDDGVDSPPSVEVAPGVDAADDIDLTESETVVEPDFRSPVEPESSVASSHPAQPEAVVIELPDRSGRAE